MTTGVFKFFLTYSYYISYIVNVAVVIVAIIIYCPNSTFLIKRKKGRQ